MFNLRLIVVLAVALPLTLAEYTGGPGVYWNRNWRAHYKEKLFYVFENMDQVYDEYKALYPEKAKNYFTSVLFNTAKVRLLKIHEFPCIDFSF